MFKQDLQAAIDDAWISDRSDSGFKINLPGKITQVCFFNTGSPARGDYADISEELDRFSSSGVNNFYLYPVRSACDDFRGMNIEHLNITEITKQNNPYCVDAKKNLTIEKGFYDYLVKIR